MAVNEVIRSTFPTQPSARSPKLRIYESLFLFNQSVDHLIDLLHGMERLPFAEKEELHSAVAEEEQRREAQQELKKKRAGKSKRPAGGRS
jgi:hypothetical protein